MIILVVEWVGGIKLYCVHKDMPLVQTRDLVQAWTGRRWKYLNNLTRKYEILLIIVYIAKTWEPNRIDPDYTETLATAQLPKQIGFSPAAGKEIGAELCFDLDESQDPKFHLTNGGEKIGGSYVSFKASLPPGKKLTISRVAIVWSETSDICTEWSSGRGMWWGSPPRQHRKAGLGYPEWSRPPRESSVVYLELTARSRVLIVNNQHARDAAVDAA